MNSLILSIIISFFISLLLGPLFIPLLHKLKFGQNIREEGPKSHKKKAGTPTMGGLIFIFATIIAYLIFVKEKSFTTNIVLFSFLGFGGIGALDDLLKIIHKENEGLKAYQKMGLLLIVAIIIGVLASRDPEVGTKILIPFINKKIDLGIWYIPFIVIYYAAVTNAVNLTDGLDGLATSVTLLVMTFLGLVSYTIFGQNSLSILCAIICGALLGFLRYNAYPAQIFMGDTGSLALGGAVAATAMILKLPLLVIIIGGIYLLEALSVIIQVISFKLTGKRVFKMAPLHHHFELSGWHETRVVAIFSITTVILCLIALLSLH